MHASRATKLSDSDYDHKKRLILGNAWKAAQAPLLLVDDQRRANLTKWLL